MLVIPVIDLKDGLAVHAVRGKRAQYAPLDCPLCRSADPYDLVDAYLALHHFPRIYIADLNALANQSANHLELLRDLVKYRPQVEFWVDAGLAGLRDKAWRPVVGTESIADPVQWQQLCKPRRAVLSLDFRDGMLIGPQDWQHTPPDCDDLIIMELDRVGSGVGPDLTRLPKLRSRLPEVRLYAAGGVRNAGDLRQLAELGFSGALVATALQQGWLKPADLAPGA